MKLSLNSKSMTNNVIRSIIIMLIGLLMIFVNDRALSLIIMIAGAGFFLPALVSLISVYVSKKEESSSVVPKVLITIIDVGSMAFGVWLMVDPMNFIDLFTVLLGIILLLFALLQLVMIVSARKNSVVTMPMFVVPLLLVVAAVIILSNPFEAESTISVVLGICAFVAGISDLLLSIKIGRAMKEASAGGALVKN